MNFYPHTITSKNMTVPLESPRNGHEANVIYVFTSWTKMFENNWSTNSTLLYILNLKSLSPVHILQTERWHVWAAPLLTHCYPTASESFENVYKLKFLNPTVTKYFPNYAQDISVRNFTIPLKYTEKKNIYISSLKKTPVCKRLKGQKGTGTVPCPAKPCCVHLLRNSVRAAGLLFRIYNPTLQHRVSWKG
jgi:hypothetical protein